MQQFTYGNHPVDEYISFLDGEEKVAVQRVYDEARKLAPDAEQAVYYGMPCLKYKNKGLVSVMVTKKFLSLYPFSAIEAVIDKSELTCYATTSGSIHFSPDHPIPEVLLRKIITTRAQNIDSKS